MASRIRKTVGFFFRNMLLLGALIATAGVSAIATMRVVLGSQEVVVPAISDKRIPEAGAIARGQGLLLKVEGKRHDPKILADRIAAQDPPAGSRLKRDRSIRAWVSLGPERLKIPAVEGESLRSARLTLEQAGITVARVVEVDAAAEEGTVLIQRPAAGDADSIGEGEALLASRGPGGDYVMPDLIGRRADDVLDALRLNGLKVTDVRYRIYPGVAPGIVLRQIPEAGHRVSRHSSVSLDVSKAS